MLLFGLLEISKYMTATGLTVFTRNNEEILNIVFVYISVILEGRMFRYYFI